MLATKNIAPRDVKYVELLEGGKVTYTDDKVQVTYPQASAEDADTAYTAAMQYMQEVGVSSLRRACDSTENFLLEEIKFGESFKLEPISGDELEFPEEDEISAILKKGADIKEELSEQWLPDGTGEFFENLSTSLEKKGGLMSFDFERFEDICYRLLSDTVINYCEEYVAEELDGYNVFCDYDLQEVTVQIIDPQAEKEDLYWESICDSKLGF